MILSVILQINQDLCKLCICPSAYIDLLSDLCHLANPMYTGIGQSGDSSELGLCLLIIDRSSKMLDDMFEWI